MAGRIPPLSARRIINIVTDSKKAKAKEYAVKFQGLVDKLRIEEVAPKHFNHLMDLSKGYFETEAIAKATGSTIDNCKNGMEAVINHIIAAQSVYPLSAIFYDKRTNKPIGFRFYNIGYRDPKKAPFSLPKPILSDQERSLFNVLDGSFNKFWEIYPQEEVVCKAEADFLDPSYRASGIFQVMVDYNVDFLAYAKATGANYIGTVCTAPATKKWYERSGFKNIHSGPSEVKNVKGEMIPLEHGELWMMVNDLREISPVDVYPFWKEMGLKKKPYDDLYDDDLSHLEKTR